MANMCGKILSKSDGIISDVKQTFSQVDYHLNPNLARTKRTAGQTAAKYIRNSRRFVAQHPAKSIALAAAFGLLAGGIASGLASSKKQVRH